MSVYLFCTLDTKGEEARFARSLLTSWGHQVVLVDTGCLGQPTCQPDVDRQTVFQAAAADLQAIVAAGDRGLAVATAAAGAAALAAQAHQAGLLTAVLGLGGSAGSTIGSAAMRALPIGVPKVLVSTLASGQTRPYVGDKDITLVNSVTDIAGINRISRLVLHNAAAAVAGMLEHRPQSLAADRPLLAATMFGVTTPCVQHARGILEQAGYEVLVFHATGNGGQAMESLIAEGLICGVLDITTTELADQCVGGVLSAGPTRLTAAAKAGVPQVISVGAVDMVNFGTFDSVPAEFAGRKLYRHNPTVTLMRTTVDENRAIGQDIGAKASLAPPGTASLLLPLRGVSAIDVDGGPFDDADARGALFQAIREHRGATPLVELDLHINDPEFAAAAAHELLRLLSLTRSSRST